MGASVNERLDGAVDEEEEEEEPGWWRLMRCRGLGVVGINQHIARRVVCVPECPRAKSFRRLEWIHHLTDSPITYYLPSGAWIIYHVTNSPTHPNSSPSIAPGRRGRQDGLDGPGAGEGHHHPGMAYGVWWIFLSLWRWWWWWWWCSIKAPPPHNSPLFVCLCTHAVNKP